jgi:ribonuclease D
MGRARNLNLLRRPHRRAALSTAERYQEFARQNLRVRYLTSNREVRETVRELTALAPAQLSVDFETTSKNGRWGVMNGSLSLVQLGVNELARGIEPQQWLIDCQQCDPRPFVGLLEDPDVEKLIHFLDFELEWSKVHLGARTITPIYDTCLAWQVINKKLKGLPAAEVQALIPGWEKHNAKLGTLVERYLGLEIPKDDQASNWGRRPLAAHQIIYAATDVAVLPALVARTRAYADTLGVSADITSRITYVKSRVHQRVGAAARSRHDDLTRVSLALERARNHSELDAIWQASRQMTLSAPSSERVRELYEQQLALVSL